MGYDLNPCIELSEDFLIYDEQQVFETLKRSNKILVELYPGINRKTIIDKLSKNLPAHKIVEIDEQYINKEAINNAISDLGNDRIFAKMMPYNIEQFYKPQAIKAAIRNVDVTEKIIVIGVGAALLKQDNNHLLLHISLPRWEIQANYRNRLSTWQQQNSLLENTQKFKFGYFFDWRIGDKIKTNYFDQVDYFIDSSDNNLTMVANCTYAQILKRIVTQPFRLTPFFDPGVWGGQWMKNKFNLDAGQKNYAWSFDGVPEENSVLVTANNLQFKVPGIDVVLLKPTQLLGATVYNKYGPEFPIRFDMLDTIDGQNLSLQVHPDSKYMLNNFGLNYTQEESYYILDTANQDAAVYIGLKDNVSKQQFFTELEAAYNHGTNFDVEKYINKIKCKKGDHFLIPAGTIHCSGSDVMVLEISQTPYIFTFKLWDWQRVDLNGVPRPINIDHGKNVVNEQYNQSFVKANLYNNFQPVDDYTTISGLAKNQDVETKIYTHVEKLHFNSNGRFQMINLVDGLSLEISSDNGSFEKMIINQYETVILPAELGSYWIKSTDESEVKYVCAQIR